MDETIELSAYLSGSNENNPQKGFDFDVAPQEDQEDQATYQELDQHDRHDQHDQEDDFSTHSGGFVVLDDTGIPYYVPAKSVAFKWGLDDTVPCVAWNDLDDTFTRAQDPTQAFMTAENIVSLHGSGHRTVFLKSALDPTCHVYGLWFAMQTRVISKTDNKFNCEPYGFSFLWLHTHSETEHMYDMIMKTGWSESTHKKPACLLPNARQSFRPSPLDVLNARKMTSGLFRTFSLEVRRALVRTIEFVNMAPYEPQHNNLLCTELYNTDDFDEEVEIEEALDYDQENNHGFKRYNSMYDTHSFLTSPLLPRNMTPHRESPIVSLSPSMRSHGQRYGPHAAHASPSTSSTRKRSRMPSSSSLLSIRSMDSDTSVGKADWSLLSEDVAREIVGHLADRILADPEESTVMDFLNCATISRNMRALLYHAMAKRIYTGAAHARALILCYDGSNLQSLPRLLSSTQRNFCCSPRYLSNLPAPLVKRGNGFIDENERGLHTVGRWLHMRLYLSASPEVIRMRGSVHI